ncbi:methylated-DNA--protein-cysteine methyltransferase, inducible [Drosophila grimshawi]|uniref:Methylated-DNA--protein-cysteine methyltransferase n=1 Tax=Drosophila grimshawi TaxID=7222 RepID=B4JGV8_DROGR|nr:methylated-DNA--protein-cysteine methyltransferase, inducible [Drosophila grimshawi]EDV93736.1 GH19491 [Drosophila grimshawi]
MWVNQHLRMSLTPLQKIPAIIKYGFINTKFGRILIGLTPIQKAGKSCDAICLLNFVQNDDDESFEEMRQRWPKAELKQDAVAIEMCSKVVFDEKENAAVIDIAIRGTDLQLSVWNELVKLKSGSTCTYSELAELVDRPKAVRAVASAVARNPVTILIPCHRIVSKNGALKYHWGAELKSALLDYEAFT